MFPSNGLVVFQPMFRAIIVLFRVCLSYTVRVNHNVAKAVHRNTDFDKFEQALLLEMARDTRGKRKGDRALKV